MYKLRRAGLWVDTSYAHWRTSLSRCRRAITGKGRYRFLQMGKELLFQRTQVEQIRRAPFTWRKGQYDELPSVEFCFKGFFAHDFGPYGLYHGSDVLLTDRNRICRRYLLKPCKIWIQAMVFGSPPFLDCQLFNAVSIGMAKLALLTNSTPMRIRFQNNNVSMMTLGAS